MYLTTFDPFTADFRAARRVFAGGMPMDGVRRENEVVLRFDVPGIDPASIEVTVDRGVLSVSAKREQASTEGERFFARERVSGSFTRRVRLSDTLNTDGIEAAYSNGVLEVLIPVAEQAKPRKVEIRQGDQKELVS